MEKLRLKSLILLFKFLNPFIFFCHNWCLPIVFSDKLFIFRIYLITLFGFLSKNLNFFA